jgi:hypothetical protein
MSYMTTIIVLIEHFVKYDVRGNIKLTLRRIIDLHVTVELCVCCVNFTIKVLSNDADSNRKMGKKC